MDNFGITDIVMDGDTLVYTAGWASEGGGREPSLHHAIFCLKRLLRSQFKAMESGIGKEIDIKKWLDKDRLRVYLTSTDKSNFRYTVAVTQGYKANREGKPKPIFYDELRQWLIDKFHAQVIYGMEADDKIGIELTKNPKKTLAWHQDKDINQVEGWHGWFESKSKYNKKIYYVDYPGSMILERSPSGVLQLNCTGEYLQAYQILIGDSSDNIPPIKKGMGPKAAYDFMKTISNKFIPYSSDLKDEVLSKKWCTVERYNEQEKLITILTREPDFCYMSNHIPNQTTIDALNEDHSTLKQYNSYEEFLEDIQKDLENED